MFNNDVAGQPAILESESLGVGLDSPTLRAKTQYTEVDGVKIAYRSIGAGTPILLCNRFRGTLDTWDYAFIDRLAANHRIVLYDYRGMGLSSGDPRIDIMAMAEDAGGLANALGLGRFIMAGWSFGGFVAQVFASAYPERVSHLALIGTGPPGQRPYPIEPLFFEHALKPLNDLADEEILFFEPRAEASRQAALQSHRRIAQRTQDLDVPMTQSQWECLLQAADGFEQDLYGTRDKLAQGQIPIMVITGDHDLVFPMANWYEFIPRVPRAHLIVFSQSGHGPQHEFPSLCADYIAAFVRADGDT